MLTYRQFITETKHVVRRSTNVENLTYSLHVGDIYYTNDKGQLHRDGGPAVEKIDGDKYWFVNGEKHRIDGPAMEYADGSKWWYFNDKLHRLDGPAMKNADGTNKWYIEGRDLDDKITDKDIWLILKTIISGHIEILKWYSMNSEMQEYILQHRPDLANQIEDLDRDLKAKYQHESEVSNADL